MSVRFARVERSIFQALAGLIPGAIRDPRAHLGEAVVVTKVTVTPDLGVAKVLVTVKGDEISQKRVISALHRAEGHLRRLLGQRIQLRRIPELVFVLDTTPETAARVEAILEELALERRQRAGDEDEASDDNSTDEELTEGERGADAGTAEDDPRDA